MHLHVLALALTPAAQIDLVKGMLDCLYAECTPCITDCVLAELEKLGQKYRVALKIAKVGNSRGGVVCCWQCDRGTVRPRSSAQALSHDAEVLGLCWARSWLGSGSSGLQPMLEGPRLC